MAIAPARPPPAPPPPRPWPESTCRGRARACPLAHALAEQARRAENEHQNQHEEREYVLIVAAEQRHLAVVGGALLLQRIGKERESAEVRHITDVTCAERLDDAEQDP